jgi:hypothetical protein
MPSLTTFIANMFGASKRLSDLERLILDSVRAKLDAPLALIWDKQVLAINKFQRLPEGVEVNFYRMKSGRPSANAELSFPNKTEELQVAKVEIALTNIRQKLVANVWCVKGFLFSIEYEGSVNYFEEAAGLEDATALQINCTLMADLAATA